MAVSAADLIVGFKTQGVAQTEGDIKRVGGAVSTFGERARAAGTALTIGLTTPLVGFGVFAVDAASDLDEAMTAATKTYGAGADFIIGKSRESARAVGLSQQEYLSAVTTFGVFGQAAGVAGEDLGRFGNDMVQTAADLASFYNVPVPEALEAIRAGLAGETEPLRRFGIFLSEAELQAYALANGIWDGTGAMTEQQKVLARQGYILEHVGAAQDDFAETSDGLANQQRVLRAEFRDVAAQIGRNLLPAALKLVGGFRDVLRWAEDLSPTFLKWGTAIGVAAAALGPLLIGVSYLAPGFAAVGVAIGLLLSPIGLLAAAVGGLAFLFRDDLADAFGVAVGFAEEAASAFAFFRDVGISPLEAALFALGSVLDETFGTDVAARFRAVGADIEGAVSGVLGAVTGFVDAVRNVGFDEAIGVLAANLQNAFGSEALTGAVVNGMQAVRALVAGEWGKVWDNLRDFAVDLGTLTVSGALALGGMIGDAAADFAGWLKGRLFGAAQVGDATGGPAGSGLSIGEIVLSGALSLASTIFGGAANFAGWLKNKLTPLAGWVLDLGGIVLNAAFSLADTVWGGAGDFAGWLIEQFGDVSGKLEAWWAGAVAIDWTGKLGDAWGSLTGFVDTDLLPKLGEAGTVLSEWWDAAVAIDWTGKLGTAWDALRGFVGSDLIPKLGEAKDALETWWTDNVAAVDWSGLLETGMTAAAIEVLDFTAWALTLGAPPDASITADGAELSAAMQRAMQAAIVGNPVTLSPRVELRIEEMSADITTQAALLMTRAFRHPDVAVGMVAGLLSIPTALSTWLSTTFGPAAQQFFAATFRGVWGSPVVRGAWEAIQDLFDTALPRLAAFGQGAASAVVPFYDELVAIRGAMEWIIDNAGRLPFIGGGGGTTASDAGNASGGGGIGGAVGGGGGGGLFDGPWTKSLVGTMPAVEAAIAKLSNEGSKHFENLRDRSGAAMATIGESITALATKVTSVTLAIESRLASFAAAATTWGINAGDGFANPLSAAFARAGANVTNVTLGVESRLAGFASAATTMGFNAGDGWNRGTVQGFQRAQGAASSHVAALRGILAVNLFAQGAAAGESYAAGLGAGLDRAVARARGATAAIYAELNRAAELARGFDNLGI